VKPRPDSVEKLMNCTTWQEVIALPEFKYRKTSFRNSDYFEDIAIPEYEPPNLEYFQEVITQLKEILTTQEYDAFIKYYMEGLSLRSAGELMNISYGKVKYLLDNADAKVRGTFHTWTSERET